LTNGLACRDENVWTIDPVAKANYFLYDRLNFFKGNIPKPYNNLIDILLFYIKASLFSNKTKTNCMVMLSVSSSVVAYNNKTCAY
jgi:hypothetical protein